MISDSCHHVPEPGMLSVTILFLHLQALLAEFSYGVGYLVSKTAS